MHDLPALPAATTVKHYCREIPGPLHLDPYNNNCQDKRVIHMSGGGSGRRGTL